MTQPDPSVYCRVCKQALTVRTNRMNMDPEYMHKSAARGGVRGLRAETHRPDPVPLTELEDPVMECDFCSALNPVAMYICDEIETAGTVATKQTVKGSDYQRRHHAAKHTTIATEEGLTNVWGERWAACAGCAALIESRDILGLVSRVCDILPTKVKRGNKLFAVRGQLTDTYTAFFATLVPGRGEITPEHPLGFWRDMGD